jgi:aspartyl-tRNA(Asn)/glutamyl-tRNA(Gln) amidotransferase subunit C
MQTDKETLQKLAHLARLEFDEKSETKMLADLNKILDWVEQLSLVDTTGVEPLIHLSEEVNIMRDDEVGEPLSHERGLRNAPKKDSDYFRVPKVID